MGINLINPSGGGLTEAQANALYLRLDTTNDPLTGDLHLDGNKLYLDDTSYLVKNGNAIELWVNNVLSASWEEDAPAAVTGEPIGLLLGLTYTA